MKSYQTHSLKFCLFIMSIFAPFAGAAEWVKLFDGKSFDGWFQTGGKHTPMKLLIKALSALRFQKKEMGS